MYKMFYNKSLTDEEVQIARNAKIPVERHIIYTPQPEEPSCSDNEYEFCGYKEAIFKHHCNIRPDLENYYVFGKITVNTEGGPISLTEVLAGGDWEAGLRGVGYYDHKLCCYRVYFPVSVEPFNPFDMVPLGNSNKDLYMHYFWPDESDCNKRFEDELRAVFTAMPRSKIVDMLVPHVYRPVAVMIVDML